MSLAEIKQAIRHLSADEWMEVQACLWECAGVPVEQSVTVDTKKSGKFVRWEDVRDEVIKRENQPED